MKQKDIEIDKRDYEQLRKDCNNLLALTIGLIGVIPLISIYLVEYNVVWWGVILCMAPISAITIFLLMEFVTRYEIYIHMGFDLGYEKILPRFKRRSYHFDPHLERVKTVRHPRLKSGEV